MNSMPLRSVLYMPGSNQRAMDKARGLPADAIIFDLEDAVAPDAKNSAREQVVAQLAAGGYGERQLVVRCNALASPWGEQDIKALAATAVGVLCLPKVESVEQLQVVRDLLNDCGRRDILLWPMIETPPGVAAAPEIAGFATVDCLVMGTSDLAFELQLPPSPDRCGLQFALSSCVLSARLAGVRVLDGVQLDIHDTAALRAVCEQGRALGFDGKTLIHPSQIAVTNEVFGLSAEAVARAARVLDVWRDAEQAGKGVAVLDGKLVETMHVDEARRTLAMAQQITRLQETE